MSDNHQMVKPVIISAPKKNLSFRIRKICFTIEVHVILQKHSYIFEAEGEIETGTRNIEPLVDLAMQAGSVRPWSDLQLTNNHTFFRISGRFWAHKLIISNYVVTLLLNLLTKKWLNLSRIYTTKITEEERHFFQRQGQQQRKTSSVSHQTLMMIKTGLPVQQFFRHE